MFRQIVIAIMIVMISVSACCETGSAAAAKFASRIEKKQESLSALQKDTEQLRHFLALIKESVRDIECVKINPVQPVIFNGNLAPESTYRKDAEVPVPVVKKK